MRTYLTAVALAAALAQPASAITFSALTTIYVGTGVQDSGTGPNTGIATVFQCSNVSGRAAVLRFSGERLHVHWFGYCERAAWRKHWRRNPAHDSLC